MSKVVIIEELVLPEFEVQEVTIVDDGHGQKKPKTICVDFDGVIHSYESGWRGEGVYNEPVPSAAVALQFLREREWYIIIYTCRDEPHQIAAYLNHHCIPFDSINENNHSPGNNSPKPHADVYLDDRAIQFNGDWVKAVQEIDSFKPWYHREDKREAQVKVEDTCSDACRKCGSPIRNERPVKYRDECYHRECIYDSRTAQKISELERKVKVFTLTAEERREAERELGEAILMAKFHPLLRFGADDNSDPEANNESKLEMDDDQTHKNDPVERGKKSTTKNFIERDDTQLHQDDPGRPAYPREIEKFHNPRHLK